jgi:ParB family chromosome partitioning protein
MTLTSHDGAEFVVLDPAMLLVDRNIREVRDDAEFRNLVASVKEHGVLQPIVAYRDETGTRVRFGHRRTLAAVEAGRDVPALVYTGTFTDEAAAEVERILGQHAENTHRTGLSPTDTIAAFGQLAALGVSPAQIARRSKTRRATVDAALAVASSEVASKAAQRWDFVTLEDAALLAEFEDDPEAVKRMVTAAKAGESTAHVAQKLRDQRETVQAIERRTTDLHEVGVPVIAEPPYDEQVIRRLEYLTHGGESLTVERHASCPGHAAYVKRAWGADKAETVYVCVHPKIHGHTDLHSRTPSGSGELSDEVKAERRRVRENNEAWRSAEKVRRRWLRDFLARRTAPKGAAALVATALAHGEQALGRAFGNRHLRALDLFRMDGMTTDDPDYDSTRRGMRGLTTLLDGVSEARALHVVLGIVLSAYEDSWGTDTWRHPGAADVRYLAFLMANGYEPSEVERLVLGAPIPQSDGEGDADDIDGDTAREDASD